MEDQSMKISTNTPTIDVVKYLRAQRLRWVGHVLRRQETFPARRVLMMEQKPHEEGSVLMDAEEHFEYDTMEELAELAENREKWNLEVNTKSYGSIGDVIALSSSDVVD